MLGVLGPESGPPSTQFLDPSLKVLWPQLIISASSVKTPLTCHAAEVDVKAAARVAKKQSEKTSVAGENGQSSWSLVRPE